MPSKNSIKQYAAESYYHIYNRGVAKQIIFAETDDYVVFLSLLKRYLSLTPLTDKQGRKYPNYSKDIELLAFCLMPNHFHLLIYQGDDSKAMEALMRSVITSYSGYFNRKYKRVGHLFQGAYKASRIDDEAYLQHISRYIHLNPKDWQAYEWSSLPYYLDQKQADWLLPAKILDIFEGESYKDFVADYEDYKNELDAIKHQLADS